MDEAEILLIEPTETLHDAYFEFLNDFRAAGEKFPETSVTPDEDFAGYVRWLQDQAKGIALKPGWVPSSTYWLVRGSRILGSCNLRHRLTEALRDFGGHIGYSVRPLERRKGYATLLLKLALEKARQLGISRALVTCDKNNAASVRVIQKNGGLMDSESYSAQAGRVTQRYWIDLWPCKRSFATGASKTAKGS